MFKATFVTSMFDSVHILKEVTKKLNLKDRETEFNFFKSYKVDSDEETFRLLEKSIEESDIVFFFLHGGISGFQKFKKLIDKYQGVKPFFIYTSIEDENREFQEKSCISSSVFEKIMAYHQIGGEKNYYSLLKYCGNKFAKKNYQVDDFDFPEWEGIYLKGKILERQNIKNQLKKLEDKFVVGVLFHARHLQKNDLQVVNAFEEELEKLGITPLIVFTNSVEEPSIKAKGLKWSIENLMSYKNKLIPKSIINLISYSQSIFSNPGNGEKFVKESIFEKYEIPIIQGMCTYQSREQWDESNVGLDMMSLVSSVYYPEFDGQIISVTCGTSERISEDQTICVPIKERVNKISRMALNWGTLSVKENKDKKVAIIFHNMPPRNDMIGCAFSLDTPASVFNMIKTLNQEGVHTDYQFKDGDEIIKKIIEGVTIDKRWLTVEKVMEKSIDKISKEKYNIWFKNLNKKASDRMIKNWGEPLGEYMVYDENIPVPGILNGNIFIGLQPPRGYDEKAEEVYHSTDIVIPHQYYSFYKWIKEEFKADIIYHVGTHGTLEWLPGKEIGLSDSCFSDINIDDIPHLYPYAVNVTGEGLQAKRRSNAVVVSHMIPSLTLADSYDSIEEIDSLIKEYYQSLSNGDKKSSIVLEKIKEICFEKKYNLDLKI
ncbi:MAG: cobaltochelatase subunit CobN, partial [Cetobacterium sp.]